MQRSNWNAKKKSSRASSKAKAYRHGGKRPKGKSVRKTRRFRRAKARRALGRQIAETMARARAEERRLRDIRLRVKSGKPKAPVVNIIPEGGELDDISTTHDSVTVGAEHPTPAQEITEASLDRFPDLDTRTRHLLVDADVKDAGGLVKLVEKGTRPPGIGPQRWARVLKVVGAIRDGLSALRS